MRRFLLTTTIAILLGVLPHAVSGQDEPADIVLDTTRAGGGWDSPRALDLIHRARLRRAQPLADTSLKNYRAAAEGFVYFFLDRRVNDQRTLVRVNQVALDLYWRQPDQARQRIVGSRDASPLPNTQRYHLDHLTMVQNGFGDIIRMGDGDEVRDVPHPAAPGSQAVYEFRVADSLELRIPTMPEPIRVYEVQVRPRTFNRSALVGSLFIDRTTADIVRMTFTFTPASYVDRRLDYINVSLDNGLWEGRYWLPNEQTVEIRRQLPELDFAVGAVIRGRMRIIDYELNADIPDSIFRARSVVALPESEREAHAFQGELYSGISEEGLSQPESLSELRNEAARMLGRRLLSGLPPLRLYMPGISSAIRYNRADGLYLGTGVTYSSGPPWRFDALAGYGFASGRPSALARATFSPAEWQLSVTGYRQDLRDTGLAPALPGALNTLSSAWNAHDYLDPWFADGAGLSYSTPLSPRYSIQIRTTAERQRSAFRAQQHAVIGGDAFRDVRPVDAGTDLSLAGELSRPLPSGETTAWGGALSIAAAHFDARDGSASVQYLKPSLRLDFTASTLAHDRDLRVRAAASLVTHDAPAQQMLFIGGRGTLPGYRFRSFGGSRAAVVDAQFTQQLLSPWVGIRATASAGAAGGTLRIAPAPGATFPTVESSDGIRTSVGIGASLFWNTLRIDRVRGLNGGEWQWYLTFTPSLDDIG